jgi:hypothetical protein
MRMYAHRRRNVNAPYSDSTTLDLPPHLLMSCCQAYGARQRSTSTMVALQGMASPVRPCFAARSRTLFTLSSHQSPFAVFATALRHRGLAYPGARSIGETWPAALRQKDCPATLAVPACPCGLVAGLSVAENLPASLVGRAHLAGKRIVRIGCPVGCFAGDPADDRPGGMVSPSRNSRTCRQKSGSSSTNCSCQVVAAMSYPCMQCNAKGGSWERATVQ